MSKKIIFDLDEFVEFLNSIEIEKYGSYDDRFRGLYRLSSNGEIHIDWSTLMNEGNHTEKCELKGKIIEQ